MNLIEYPDRDFLMMRAADLIVGELRAALGHEERVTFAVPGGTTPGPIFDTLASVDLDWDRVDVLPTDERWVAEDSDRSNARLIRRRLLTGKAAPARFQPLWLDLPQPEDGLAALTEAVTPLLPISVALLGMGEDMHCASIFPDGDNLLAALAPDAPVLLAMRRPGSDEVRVTLTMPQLTAAMSIHLLITGNAKRDALLRAQDLDPEQAPVAGLLSAATVHWAE